MTEENALMIASLATGKGYDVTLRETRDGEWSGSVLDPLLGFEVATVSLDAVTALPDCSAAGSGASVSIEKAARPVAEVELL